MANQANIKAVITAEDRASATLKGFSGSVNTMSAGMVAKGMLMADAFQAVGKQVIEFGKDTLKAFSEAQDGIKQTETVIKSTGGIAGVTADEVTKLATALQKTTKFSDEQVRSAENLLLTFTAIGKDIFPQATKTVLDMSTALGQDTKSSAIQLGKALQDPVLGITALRRVGVNFTDKQKDVIQALVDTGKKAEAQKLILQELQVEFGGSAEAAGTTFAGSLAKLKNSFNDVQESVGKTIVEAITPFIAKAAEFIASVDWEKVINKTTQAIKSLINVLIFLKNTAVDVYNYLSPGFERFIFIVGEVVKIVNNFLGPSFNALVNTIQTRLLPQLMALWNAIEPGFTGALKVLGVVIGAVVIAAMYIFINTLNIIISVLGFVIRTVSNAITIFGNLAGVIINAFGNIPNFLSSVFSGLASIIVAPFRIAFNLIADLWNGTVGKLSFKAPSWIPGFGGKGWEVPDIPHMAEGGIVTKPTIALIGEAGPEAVIPLGKNMGNSSGSININMSGIFTGSDIEARKLANMILGHLRDTAGSKNMTLGQMIG